LIAQLNQNKKWKRLIEQKKMAVGLVDLRDPLNVKYARVNGNVMMYAASLPKIAVLLAAEDALEKGELEDSKEIENDLRLMISRSDNAASTRMIDRLGYEKIESVLTDPKYDLYDEDYGGGLWVGKRYAKTGARYPDPLKGLSHGATVSQVCRYYYMLAYGKLVSFERSKIMLDLMVNPELHHKFVNSLEKVAPKAKIFRKSGTWKNFHTDSALVWGPEWRRYIIVALIEDPDGEKICRDLIMEVEKVIKH
jgi:beta-lactamase class A